MSEGRAEHAGDARTDDAVRAHRPVILPMEKWFHVHDGLSLPDIPALYAYARTMPLTQYTHHAGKGFNHFADWIEDVFHEKELARRVRECLSPNALAQELKDYLVHASSGAPAPAGPSVEDAREGMKEYVERNTYRAASAHASAHAAPPPQSAPAPRPQSAPTTHIPSVNPAPPVARAPSAASRSSRPSPVPAYPQAKMPSTEEVTGHIAEIRAMEHGPFVPVYDDREKRVDDYYGTYGERTIHPSGDMDDLTFSRQKEIYGEHNEAIGNKFDAMRKQMVDTIKDPIPPEVERRAEELKGRYDDLMVRASELRKRGKDCMFAAIVLRQFLPKLAYAKVTREEKDFAFAEIVLIQAKAELDEAEGLDIVDVRKEVAERAERLRQTETPRTPVVAAGVKS